MAQLAWHDWFPSVWLDQHQMGSNGAAHLRDAGDRSDQPERSPADLPLERASSASRRPRRSKRPARTASSTTRPTRTSGRARWRGAAGGTTRSACSPKSRARASPRRSISSARRAGASAPAATDGRTRRARRAIRSTSAPLAAADRHHAAHRVSAPLAGRPLDAPRHRRLRADRDDGAARDGGRSARDDPAADLRGQPADGRRRQDRATSTAILVPLEAQHDPREAAHLVDRLQIGGVEVYRADAAFEADEPAYAAGTFVIPMTQVFARYAKDLLEKQTYPEVRRGAQRAGRAAVRRDRLVARHAVRRRRRLRQDAAAADAADDAGRRPAADRRAA